MKKPADDSKVLFVTPEAIYPKTGGGALRSASIFEYLEAHHAVDAIAWRGDFAPIAIPGARDLLILDLPHHSRTDLARGVRNLRRVATGSPPLVDRFSGFDDRIAEWLQGRHYETALVEHFWCAPYARVLRPHVDRLVLDLHNVESALSAGRAASEPFPLSATFRRFASAFEDLEREWLPQFDDVLVASGADANRVDAARVSVYPNTIPYHDAPRTVPDHAIIFTGNLEYDPNIAAVRWFAREVWPLIRSEEPGLEWRLAGRNGHAVEEYTRGLDGIRLVGEMDDAVVEIARAKVAIIPLLAGSGTRFKILEAWAAARPVVSTTVGAEGLGATDGHQLLIADTPEQFARAVIRTVRDPGELGQHGRELYLERYTTEAGWKMLASLGL